MRAKKIGQRRIKPRPVSDFEREFAARWKLLQERRQHPYKMQLRGKLPAVKRWELKNHGPKLRTEEVHRSEKFVEFRIAVHQNLFVGNALRNFDRKDEVFW